MFVWIKQLIHQRRLFNEIRQFYLWKRKRHPTTAEGYQQLLMDFAHTTKAESCRALPPGDIEAFLLNQNGVYLTQRAAQAISALVEFTAKPSKRGRPVHTRQMNRAKRLRQKGLSFREIARVLDVDSTQVFRWAHHGE